tara:strand:+ start:2517 stop:3302 length:786 start_codon:yes stop_codon:yes gene_type:complete
MKELFLFDPTFNWATLIQLFGFIGAIWGVSFQLAKQRELQKENHKNELQVSIYKNITSQIEGSSPTGIATSLWMVVGSLDEARGKLTPERPYVPPPFRVEKLHDDFKEINNRLWKVASSIEKFEIVSPNLSVFREVFVIKLKELSERYMPLLNILPHVLLSDDGINEAENLLVLDDAAIELLEEKANSFGDAAYDVAAYLHDIQVELQNSLLGDFFGNKISIRTPPDEQLVLTSTDPVMVQRAKDYVTSSNIDTHESVDGT